MAVTVPKFVAVIVVAFNVVTVAIPALPRWILLPTLTKSSKSPAAAVTIPTESILVTSSYVKVPPMDTLPPITNDDAVIIPEAVSYTHLTLPTKA